MVKNLTMGKRPKTKVRFFLLLALVVVGFFGLLTVFGDEGLLKLKSFYSLRDRIRRENQEIFNSNQKLIEQINLLKEPLYAERLIREKLGYVKAREYILILNENSGMESQPNYFPAQDPTRKN
jgi:cell division protein FtsB